MKSVLLIGLGKFGQTLGEDLLEVGADVMIVDKNEAVVNQLAPKYTDALIANCMNEDNLRSLDIPSFDVCIVAIGDDFQSSLEITSLLKELGAKHVISRATTNIQRKFLLRNGADEVVYPDKDIAERLAMKLSTKRVVDYIALSDDYSIFEITVPSAWHGKKIVEVNPRKAYGMNILTVKNGEDTLPTPDGEYTFKANDHIVVFGNTEEIVAFTKGKKK